MHLFLVFAKYALAITSVIVALYVGIGSLIFGPWWYRWLYDGKFKDLTFTLNGIKDLLTSWFPWVIGVFIGGLAVVLLGTTLQPSLFRALDKFGWLITFAALWVLALASAHVYHRYHPIVGGYFEAIKRMNEDVSSEIRALTSLPAVQPPIDFHYLEAKRIDALYSQLEPELVERLRTVADRTTGRGNAGVAVGPANAEGAFEKAKTLTSSYTRPDFSSERKCIAVMSFVVENNRAAYYSTRESWLGTKRIVSSILERQRNLIESQRSLLYEKLGMSDPAKAGERPTQEDAKTVEDLEQKQVEYALHVELENLRGLVFLDSVFETSPDGDDALLVTEFSHEPKRVLFRVSVPQSARSEIPVKARLRVFGDVTRTLPADGYVDIRAIAVY